MSEFVIDKVAGFAAELLPSMGLELVEVQFRREQHGWVLRLFIDTEEGVTLDHCSKVSRELGDYLDVEDIIDHQYHLEVSSPGLERKLATLQDFERFRGSKAKIKMRQPLEGNKTFTGIISGVEGSLIGLEMEDDKEVEINFDMVSMARLAI
ncbi:MAG: ribosome maturation factor RimP [Desulfopila sp.]|jgi:ribosome maturation factor RimP|nr:ribosome maturation factor RimP [Desulfopila sp.]